MKLSPQSKVKLEESGLTVLENDNRCFVLKETGIAGNRLPDYESRPIVSVDEKGEFTNEIVTDCPVLRLRYQQSSILLCCWDWVPGPGPGDFEKEFVNEEELLEFIISYYFGSNEYFEERRKYEERS